MARSDTGKLLLYVKPYLQPSFLICTAVLAIAASGMSMAIKSLGVILSKDPIPLKKPLDFLDGKGLGPFEVVSKKKIENQEIVKSLGTEEYIQWVLQDTEVSDDSPVRSSLLFITYYELPDRVVHVPEECYMGTGSQRLTSENVSLKIYRSDAGRAEATGSRDLLRTEQIPAKYLVFSGPKSSLWEVEAKFPIFYLFSVNGQYKASRENTRLVLNKNIYGKHSYFSKVEWQFFGTKFGRRVYPRKSEAIAASEKLLSVILPILEKEHWPDWDK